MSGAWCLCKLKFMKLLKSRSTWEKAYWLDEEGEEMWPARVSRATSFLKIIVVIFAFVLMQNNENSDFWDRVRTGRKENLWFFKLRTLNNLIKDILCNYEIHGTSTQKWQKHQLFHFLFSQSVLKKVWKTCQLYGGECCSEKMQVDLVHSELICQTLKRCERIFGAYFANNVPRLQPEKGLVGKKIARLFRSKTLYC